MCRALPKPTLVAIAFIRKLNLYGTHLHPNLSERPHRSRWTRLNLHTSCWALYVLLGSMFHSSLASGRAVRRAPAKLPQRALEAYLGPRQASRASREALVLSAAR